MLNIPPNQHTVFERFSDSSSSYVTLDSTVPSVYKQLYRAAKAKQKLKIRVTVIEKEASKVVEMPKPGSALPERLSTRCYVHPYISDPVKTEDEVKPPQDEHLTLLEQFDNPSYATLVAPVQSSSEVPLEKNTTTTASSNKSYYWPITHDSGLSGAAMSVFEKKDTGSKETVAKKATEDEAPVPRFFTDRDNFLSHHANITQKLESFRLAPEQHRPNPGTNFTICCNNCEEAIPDAHWHCGICDTGDFDLCKDCVDKGNLCDNDDHWLIKRFVKDGKVIPSTTETIGPKKPAKVEDQEKVPGAFTSELKREETREPLDLSRTCNSCVGGKTYVI